MIPTHLVFTRQDDFLPMIKPVAATELARFEAVEAFQAFLAGVHV